MVRHLVYYREHHTTRKQRTLPSQKNCKCMESTSSWDADIAGDLIWSRSNLTPLTSYCQVRASLSTADSPASITGLFTESRYVQSRRYIGLTLTPCALLYSQPDIISPCPLPNDECTYKYFFRHLCCHSFIIGRHVSLYHVSVSHVSDEIDPITEESLQHRTQPRDVSCNPQKSILTLYWALSLARSVHIKY